MLNERDKSRTEIRKQREYLSNKNTFNDFLMTF